MGNNGRTERGTFYVIGTGPAGPATCTLEALETMARVDRVAADAPHIARFAKYLGDKPVLFDPWEGLWWLGKERPWSELGQEEREEFGRVRREIVDRRTVLLEEALASGLDVGLLDSGNPCLFGPSAWYAQRFPPEEVVIIPGMGVDAAALAAVKRNSIPAFGSRYLVMTAPFMLAGGQGSPDTSFDPESPEAHETMARLAAGEHSLILYMGIKDPVRTFQFLGRHLSGDTPAACVYWAGYPDRQRVVRGTVADLGPRLEKESDDLMGLLLVGRFLEGPAYQSALGGEEGR